MDWERLDTRIGLSYLSCPLLEPPALVVFIDWRAGAGGRRASCRNGLRGALTLRKVDCLSGIPIVCGKTRDGDGNPDGEDDGSGSSDEENNACVKTPSAPWVCPAKRIIAIQMARCFIARYLILTQLD